MQLTVCRNGSIKIKGSLAECIEACLIIRPRTKEIQESLKVMHRPQEKTAPDEPEYRYFKDTVPSGMEWRFCAKTGEACYRKNSFQTWRQAGEAMTLGKLVAPTLQGYSDRIETDAEGNPL